MSSFSHFCFAETLEKQEAEVLRVKAIRDEAIAKKQAEEAASGE